MRSIGHRQHSSSAPDSGLSSSSDRFYAFLPRCLCAMCSWDLPSFSSHVDSRPEPTWWCCWLASWGCGHSSPVFFYGSERPLVPGLLASTGAYCLSSLATRYRGFCTNSCWSTSGANGVLIESFSMSLIQRCTDFHICVKNPQLGAFSNLSGASNILENQEGSSRFAHSCPHICVCPTLCVNHASLIGKRADFFKGLSCCCDWSVTDVLHPHDLCLPLLIWRPIRAVV